MGLSHLCFLNKTQKPERVTVLLVLKALQGREERRKDGVHEPYFESRANETRRCLGEDEDLVTFP